MSFSIGNDNLFTVRHFFRATKKAVFTIKKSGNGLWGGEDA